jgi:hypothetical protein
VALIALSFLMFMLLAGCKHAEGPVADVDPTGIYTLVSVDGKDVPCDVKHGDRLMTVNSGTFSISNADHTCRSVIDFSVASHPVVTREVKATYVQDGSGLTMKWEGAGVTQGTVKDNTFTMVNEGMTFTYRK